MVRVKPSSSTSVTASGTWATSSLTTPNRSHHSTTATGCSTSSTTPTGTSWRTSGRDDSTSPCRSARGSTGNTLKFGAKYTSKNKKRTTSFFDYDPEEVLGDDWRSNTSLQIRYGFMPGSQYPANSPFISISTLGNIDFSQYEGTENYEEEAGNYKISEQITAGYLRFDQKIGKKLSATTGSARGAYRPEDQRLQCGHSRGRRPNHEAYRRHQESLYRLPAKPLAEVQILGRRKPQSLHHRDHLAS